MVSSAAGGLLLPAKVGPLELRLTMGAWAPLVDGLASGFLPKSFQSTASEFTKRVVAPLPGSDAASDLAAGVCSSAAADDAGACAAVGPADDAGACAAVGPAAGAGAFAALAAVAADAFAALAAAAADACAALAAVAAAALSRARRSLTSGRTQCLLPKM